MPKAPRLAERPPSPTSAFGHGANADGLDFTELYTNPERPKHGAATLIHSDGEKHPERQTGELA